MTRPSDRPTDRQLRYLRTLALKTGTTFTAPTTKSQASREIERLKRLQPVSRTEKRVEQASLHTDRNCLKSASAVQPHEITGHGSSTKWANARSVNEHDPFLIL